MHCSYTLWRFGQATPFWLLFEKLTYWVIFIVWLFYVFIEKEFISYFDKGNIALVDLLLGLPLILALGLVFSVIWKGVIRGLLCLMNKLVLSNDVE